MKRVVLSSSRRIRIAGLAVVAGCVPVSVAAAAPAATSPGAGLEKLFPTAGEVPGFTRTGSIFVADTLAKDVAADPKAIKATDRANLTKDGFRVELTETLKGKGESGGSAGITELGSPAAAAAYVKYTYGLVSKPGLYGSTAVTRYVIFKVPGVPGATGAAEIDRNGKQAVANVQWVEGDCQVELGAGTNGAKPITAPLIAGAQAIYQRTKGSCTA